jgi:drug/metabolite transporter (DMT)-like permease
LIQVLNKWDWLFITYEPMNPMSYVGAGCVVTGVALTIIAQRRNIKPKSVA